MSSLVGNPEDKFSHEAAHLLGHFTSLSLKLDTGLTLLLSSDSIIVVFSEFYTIELVSYVIIN